MSRARSKYQKSPTRATLRAYLILKAKTGRWDARYCRYYGVSADVNSATKRFITRGYAAGLVPTSTTGGRHAPGSYHSKHAAADLGLIERHIGKKYGRDKMVKFQRAEERAFRAGRRRGMVELIGPDNRAIVLRGRRADLAEGAGLENQHDNHVHGAFV